MKKLRLALDAFAILLIVALFVLLAEQQRYINHLENIVDTAVSGSVSLPAAVACGPST